MLNPDARDYLRHVRKRLPMRGDAEERYLEQLEMSLSDYCAENGPKSAAEIAEAFGSPQAVVDTYLSELDTGQVIRHADVRKPVRACMLAALTAVLLAALTAGVAAFWCAEESRIIESYDVPTYFSAEALPEEEDLPG